MKRWGLLFVSLFMTVGHVGWSLQGQISIQWLCKVEDALNGLGSQVFPVYLTNKLDNSFQVDKCRPGHEKNKKQTQYSGCCNFNFHLLQESFLQSEKAISKVICQTNVFMQLKAD